MPLYKYNCPDENCSYPFDVHKPIRELDREEPCPKCGTAAQRIMQAPMVMSVALPDGTRRFQKVREFQQLERAKREFKRKGDKDTLSKIAAEQSKITSKE